MKQSIIVPPEVAAVIPYSQLLVTKQNPEACAEPLERLAERVRKCPRLYETDGKAEHPAIFHYFYGSTDIFICEFDGEEEMFGFSILNGDLDNSEWGYISLAEIRSVTLLNLDYYWEEQSIEAALYRKYPNHYKKPASLNN
jgi:hypothetical protein